MESIFVPILFGHVVGDYFFQNKKTAIMKSERTLKGIIRCYLHGLMYTLSMLIFTLKYIPSNLALIRFIMIIWATHVFIDGKSLGQWWLDHIKGRNFIKAHQSKDKYREIDIAFSCIVYTVVDNAMHLMIAYYTLLWLIGG